MSLLVRWRWTWTLLTVTLLVPECPAKCPVGRRAEVEVALLVAGEVDLVYCQAVKECECTLT